MIRVDGIEESIGGWAVMSAGTTPRRGSAWPLGEQRNGGSPAEEGGDNDRMPPSVIG